MEIHWAQWSCSFYTSLLFYWSAFRNKDHSCVQSTNLLTPMETHWAQWSCSCYTSLLFSPGHSLLEYRDTWHIPRALLLGYSKMQGVSPSMLMATLLPVGINVELANKFADFFIQKIEKIRQSLETCDLFRHIKIGTFFTTIRARGLETGFWYAD